MARHILILLIISSTIVYGQNNLDTLKIDDLLTNIKTSDKSSIADIKIIKTIQAFDNNFFKIVSFYKYPTSKHTIISSDEIQIRQLIDKDKILKIILSDNIRFKKDIDVWNKSNHDTTKFLSAFLVENNQLELSELYMHKSTLLEELNELTSNLKPLTISQKLRLKNIIFYSDRLTSTADSIARKINKHQKQDFYKYIKNNYDYFDINKKKFDLKDIYISSIIFSFDNLVYVGVDLYGRHFLLTFDSSDNWNFVNSKPLWIN